MKFTTFIFCLTVCFAILCPRDSAAQIPSGAIFWLMADSGIVFSQNNVVAEWKDQSGTTKSAFQSLPVSQPTLLPSAFNNRPAVHFDGRFDYMDCAPLFPVSKDYSIAIVARVADLLRMNHLVSGNTHAIYVQTSGFPTVQNDTAPAPLATSQRSVTLNKPAIIIVTYQQDIQVAKIFLNGELADSAFIGANKDPKIYLGAFQGVGAFSGDLAEIVLYSRALPESDRKQLEDYLFTKYSIPPSPAPDSIYTEVPKHLQFYARDADDSATVTISGKYNISGFDSLYVKTFKDGIQISRIAQKLHYEAGNAVFSLSPRIHAELAEYSFLFGVKSATTDKQIGFRDSIVCGDVMLISGQSNAIMNNLGYTNEFFRTFGENQAASAADTAWAIAGTSVCLGFGAINGSLGIRMQEDIMNTFHLPTCVINGGAQTTGILQHLPDSLNRRNITTFYGNMLYRAVKAGIAEKAKALFWYQGESDSVKGYAAKFKALYKHWKEDYPNIRKIYLLQVRPGCTLGFNEDLRDLQRTMQDSFPDVVSVSTMGITGHDGCHFLPEGYIQLADQLFKLVARDFYGSADNSQISSPDIIQAYYTNSERTRVGLTFAPDDTRFIIPGDTVIGGIPSSLKDYFFLDETGEVAQSMSTTRNKVFLDLSQSSSARLINYLPDKYFNHTSAIYEGPWLKNERGVGAFSFYHVPIVDSAQADVKKTGRQNDLLLSVYPNPGNGKFFLSYSAPCSCHATIYLFDVLGRNMYSEMKDITPNEKCEEVIDANQLGFGNGVYLCKFQCNDISRTVWLTLHR